jgi:carboxymethylenebutenolidase
MRTPLSLLLYASCLQVMSQDFAVKQLESSSRHHEWVQVKSGSRNIQCFVAYPEIPAKATSVIVIHENRGLTDWVRSFADQLAKEGYLAIAPDLLSESAPGIKNTQSFESSDKATSAIYELDPVQVSNDLTAVQQFIQSDKSCNGKTAVIGFCWGGGQSFRFATNNNKIRAAMVFYGGAPDKAEDIRRIAIPVYGFYAGNDERVNAGIPSAESMMKQENKQYMYEIYPGAGHAYMRLGDDPAGTAENKKARDESWKRLKLILSGL